MRHVAPLFPSYPRSYYHPLNSSHPIMSHTHPTSTPPNFQLIFAKALKAYKRRTKVELLTHPLADRLETCDSANSILTVLRGQLQELDESQCSNTRWLDSTVNVLQTLSETIEERFSSVRFRHELVQDVSSHIYLTGILTCKGYFYRIWHPSFSVYPS